MEASALVVALGDVIPMVAAVVALRPNDPDVEGGLEPADFLSVLSCTSGVHCWKIQHVLFFFLSTL